MPETEGPEPSEIFAEIKAQPPLMRQQAANTYISREVHWALTFENGSEEPAGQAWLVFRFDPDNMRMVTGRVSLSDYSSLRSLRSGESILVHGQVRKIDMLSIELEIRDLVFERAAKVTH